MKKTTLFVFALLLLSTQAFTQEAKSYQRRVSVDTQYFTIDDKHSVPSNRAIGDFTVEFLGGSGYLFDKVGDWTHAHTSAWTRLPYILLFGGGVFTFFQEPLALAYHEMGHASRLRALGAKPRYSLKGSSHKFSNFFSFMLKGLGKEVGDATVEPSGQTVFGLSEAEYQIYGSGNSLNNQMYLMGGLNNEMYLAELLEDQTYYRGGHVMEAANYVTSKLATAFYIEDLGPVGDVENIRKNFIADNIQVDEDKLTSASEMSLLLSTTTYAYLYGMYNYVKTGKSTVDHFTYKGVRLPDLSFYMTRRGLSYKFNSGYQFANKKSWLIVALEHVFEGNDADELTLGYRQNFELKGKKAMAELLTMVGPSMSATLKTSVQTTKRLWMTLGLSHFNVHSLWGERHIPSLQGNDADQDIWGKLSYYY